jgi:hypothetical protein
MAATIYGCLKRFDLFLRCTFDLKNKQKQKVLVCFLNNYHENSNYKRASRLYDDNIRKCKVFMEETPLEIGYSSESGNKRPMAIGKVVVQRYPFDYLKYLDTPLIY